MASRSRAPRARSKRSWGVSSSSASPVSATFSCRAATSLPKHRWSRARRAPRRRSPPSPPSPSLRRFRRLDSSRTLVWPLHLRSLTQRWRTHRSSRQKKSLRQSRMCPTSSRRRPRPTFSWSPSKRWRHQSWSRRPNPRSPRLRRSPSSSRLPRQNRQRPQSMSRGALCRPRCACASKSSDRRRRHNRCRRCPRALRPDRKSIDRRCHHHQGQLAPRASQCLAVPVCRGRRGPVPSPRVQGVRRILRDQPTPVAFGPSPRWAGHVLSRLSRFGHSSRACPHAPGSIQSVLVACRIDRQCGRAVRGVQQPAIGEIHLVPRRQPCRQHRRR